MARDGRRLRRPAAAGGPALTGDAVEPAAGRAGTILQGDRRKAYRPLDPAARRRALEAGLAAYARGDYFEAHELLEPAWMGTADLAERALYQGLIKLAAGYVHQVRGNPLGMARNLAGARTHLATSGRLDPARAEEAGVDLPALLAAIDERLAAIDRLNGSQAAAGGVTTTGPAPAGSRGPVTGVPPAPTLGAA